MSLLSEEQLREAAQEAIERDRILESVTPEQVARVGALLSQLRQTVFTVAA